jgi:hypothetical protein
MCHCKFAISMPSPETSNVTCSIFEFHPEGPDGWRSSRDYVWKTDPKRGAILDWFEASGFGWEICGPFADVQVLPPYRRQVYLDVPYDETLESFNRLKGISRTR